jgi:hypothetical protein
MSALNKPPVGPPPSATPPSKRDMPNPLLLDYRRIRVSLERCLENESDSQFAEVLHTFHLAMTQRESGAPTPQIVQLISPMLMALGQAPAGPGAPTGAPPGAPDAQGPPQGQPPQVQMGPGA